jgi:hypothetical protein
MEVARHACPNRRPLLRGAAALALVLFAAMQACLTAAHAQSTKALHVAFPVKVPTGGISTITSPSGRIIAPLALIAAHTFAPSASSYGKDSLVVLSFTISTPAITPHCRTSPTYSHLAISARYPLVSSIFSGMDSSTRFVLKSSSDAIPAAHASAFPV